MRRILISSLFLLALAHGGRSQGAPDGAELTRLLNEFLAGAARNDAAVHDRFWAEDLIYTGSSGRRIGKAEILRGARPAPAARPGDPTVRYSAEDLRIQQYGDTAIVAFRLVSTTERDGKTQVANFLNSGTFLKRQGKWQVVSWQATRMPASAEEEKRAALAAETAFHKALLASDHRGLESLTDEGFVWTRHDGGQVARRQLLDDLNAGRVKYSRLETADATVSLHGESAVVRGRAIIQSKEAPGPVTTFYSLTLVNRGGAWVAVALHSSR